MRIVIVLFIFLLQYNPGSLESVTNFGWKVSSLVETTSNMFKDLKRDENGSVMNLQKSSKGFRRLSKAFSAAGATFALAGVVSGFFIESEQQQMHQELMEEFSKVHYGIEKLGIKIDGTERLIEHEHAMTRISPYLLNLLAITTKFDLHRTGQSDHATQLKHYYQNSDISDAMIAIYNNILGETGMNSWIDTTYSKTNGKYSSVKRVGDYLQLILPQATTVFTFACALSERDTKTEFESSEDCQKQSDNLFGHLAEEFQKKMYKVLNNCLINYETNIGRMLDDQLSKHGSQTNDQFAYTIRDRIEEDYFWVHASIVVYNGCWTGSNHWTSAHIKRFRKGDQWRNVSIFLSRKPGYRNNFRTRTYLKSVSEEKVAKIVKDSVLLRKYLMPSAKVYYENIETRVSRGWVGGWRWSHLRTDYLLSGTSMSSMFNGFTVVRHGNGLRAISTTYSDQHFFLNYEGYSIIGQLKDGYSFFTACPNDFPYAYNYGKQCKKSLNEKDKWYSNSKSSDASVPCVSPRCRDGKKYGQVEYIKVSEMTATSSSTYEDNYHRWGPNFVIDGKISASSSSILHTKKDKYSWVQIALSSPRMVYGVEIINRADCCGDRLRELSIRIGMESVPVGTTGDVLLTHNEWIGVFHGPGITGDSYRIMNHYTIGPKLVKFITFQHTGGEYLWLNLNELKVISY